MPGMETDVTINDTALNRAYTTLAYPNRNSNGLSFSVADAGFDISLICGNRTVDVVQNS